MTRDEMGALIAEADHDRHGGAGYGLLLWMRSGVHIVAPDVRWDRARGVLWLGGDGEQVVALEHIEAARIDWSPGGRVRRTRLRPLVMDID